MEAARLFRGLARIRNFTRRALSVPMLTAERRLQQLATDGVRRSRLQISV